MRFRLLIVVMVFSLDVTTLFARNDSPFELGMQAFKSEDYSQAIRYFNQAKFSGHNQFVIEYNLGVSHYKLGQYLQAERAFQGVLASNKLQSVAQYNLGLVKLKQKQKREAIEWFRKAANSTDDPKIRGLANRMIEKYRISKKRTNFVNGGINVAYSHNSNVTQAATGSPSAQSDNVLETYAFLKVRLEHVDFKLSYFNQDFSTINSNDFTQLGTTLGFPFRTGKWRITPALAYTTRQLNATDYQSTSGLRLDLKRYISKGDYLRFRYRYTDIQSDNPLYDYLDGTRHRFRAEYIHAAAIGRLRLRYEYEINDRQDEPGDAGNGIPARNYSPTRHSLRLQLRNTLPATFRMKNEIIFRNSVYEDAAGFIRKDDRWQYRFDLYAVPVSELELGMRYTYTDNNSNLSGDIFSRNVTQGYLNWYF